MLNLLTDPYERKARVTPGLLVSLPILVPLVCVYGPKQPTLTAVFGLLGGCGAIYALASISRGRGKKLEEDLVSKWGGLPSTLALRHRDKFFDRITKQRYHADISSKLGISMPTADQEAANPAAADEAYVGATRRLRELTRGDKQLLLKENIAYGFHRNMLAMKGVGLLTCIMGLVYGLVIAGVLHLKPLGITPGNLGEPGLAGGLTLLVSFAMLLAWSFYFDEDKVQRIGFVYAERLFEHLPSLSGTPKARAPRTKKASSNPATNGDATS
jgi:hypothetical protein